MASKSFLWGLINIPMFEYRWVLTIAQIELLSIDKPVVNYRIGKDKKSKFKRPNMVNVLDKAKEWENKYKDGSKPKIDLTGFVKK